MSKLSELVDAIDTLTIEEMEEIKKAIEKKWLRLREQKIVKEVRSKKRK